MPCFIWNVSPVIGTTGPITIHWYGLFFAMAFLVGYCLLYWQMRRAGRIATLNDLFSFCRLVIYLIVGIILGAYLGNRIFYQWHSFFANPLATMEWKSGLSGLSSHGAAVGILMAAYLFHRRTGIRLVEVMDRLTFSSAVGAIAVRLGNLMNSECLGRPTSLPWAFCFPRHDAMSLPRHPTQIYEAILGVGVLLTLFIVDHKFGGEKRPPGLLSGVFFLGYFTLRFIIEFFKEGEALFPPLPFTLPQLLSLPLALLGPILIIRSLKRQLPASRPV